MVNKTVMSVNMDCYKCKRMALGSFTEIDGIDSIEFNMKEKTITVVGDADPVCMANLLRRKFKCARIISYGPPPKKDTGDSKEKPEKNEKNPKKNGKGSGSTPDEQPQKNPVKEGKSPDFVPIICYPPPYMIHSGYNAAPHCGCGLYPCSCRSDVDLYVVTEETPPCTIC